MTTVLQQIEITKWSWHYLCCRKVENLLEMCYTHQFPQTASHVFAQLYIAYCDSHMLLSWSISTWPLQWTKLNRKWQQLFQQWFAMKQNLKSANRVILEIMQLSVVPNSFLFGHVQQQIRQKSHWDRTGAWCSGTRGLHTGWEIG